MGFNVTSRTPNHRFVATTWEEYLVNVHTVWNLLDRVMQVNCRHAVCPMSPYGYMRPVQLDAYGRAMWQRRNEYPLTYCETGVNGGHGTAAMLLAHQRLTVHSFDWAGYGYSEPVFTMLQLYFGERVAFHRGDSRKTLPAFFNLTRTSTTSGNVWEGQQCDVMLVDGDHRLSGASRDLAAFRAIAACNGTLFVDDLNEGPGEALRKAVVHGWIAIDEWHTYRKGDATNNPCLRGTKGGLRCPGVNGWGWARARMVGARACGEE